MVVSTAKTLEHLKTRDADYWRRIRPAKDLLPNDTFDGRSRSSARRQDGARLPSRPRPHRRRLVVLFVEDRVLHTGDLFSNGVYPNIDLEAGGSVQQWPATLDNVARPRRSTRSFRAMAQAPTARALERYRDFMTSLWTQTAQIRERGGSLETRSRSWTSTTSASRRSGSRRS